MSTRKERRHVLREPRLPQDGLQHRAEAGDRPPRAVTGPAYIGRVDAAPIPVVDDQAEPSRCSWCRRETEDLVSEVLDTGDEQIEALQCRDAEGCMQAREAADVARLRTWPLAT